MLEHRLKPNYDYYMSRRAAGAAAKLIILLAVIFSLACSITPENAAGISPAGIPYTVENSFLSPEAAAGFLSGLESRYPGLCSLKEIGRSERGRPIYALEIGGGDAASVKPAVLICGGIHGDEQLSTAMVLRLAEDLLLAGSRAAAGLHDLLFISVVPVLNPDGLDAGRRYNANMVDLNRNFGYNWHEDENYSGKAAFDQTESAALRDYYLSKAFCLSLSLHTASYTSDIGIYSAWDAVQSTVEDFEENYLPNWDYIRRTGGEYAELVAASGGHPFSKHFSFGEGGDWYVMNGSMNDWAMGILGSLCYTVEIYGGKNFTSADADLISTVWDAHSQAVLQIMRKAAEGSGGIVTDQSGNPLSGAGIKLQKLSTGARGSGAAAKSAFTPAPYPVLTGRSGEGGEFRLLTGAGRYRLTIGRDGYRDLSLEVDLSGSGLTTSGGGDAGAAGSGSFFPRYSLEIDI